MFKCHCGEVHDSAVQGPCVVVASIDLICTECIDGTCVQCMMRKTADKLERSRTTTVKLNEPQSYPTVRPLDIMIGRLDRLLSEFLIHASDETLDEADIQTIKHHADDLIGVGKAALRRLGVDEQ